MYCKFFKRVIDFSVALVGLIVISPIFLLLILLLAVANRGNVFFTQERPGKGAKVFRVIKVKTMNDKRGAEGKLLPDADRLTKIGKFVRSTSLDELPQLINVIKGDMSLVGPRPLRTFYLPLYSAEQARRHELKPGITGWAQVNGRNNITWTKKFELDVWYVDNCSFILDCRILFMTLVKVIKRSDINKDSQATTVRFNGYN